MNEQISQEHAAVWELLPLHAAGRLAPAESAQVAAHLAACAACRAELAWQQELHGAAARADGHMPVPDMDAALARLLPRLDEPAVPAARQPPAPGAPATLAAALARFLARLAPLGRFAALPAACAVALVALSLSPQPSDQAPGYEGLGPVSAAGNVTVMFRPDTGAGDVRRILAVSGATAVHGPTVAGAYVLELQATRRGEALARLRAEPAVLLAEPLDARVPP